MKQFSMVLGLLALLALLTLAPVAAQQASPASGQSTTVQLNPQNNSGESGTATLTAQGNQTHVVINLNGAPPSAQPAHIHQGTCANLNPKPQYPLNDVTNGKSDTTVNASLASLMNGNSAINVHKSAAEIQTYVACGDIPAGTAGTMGQTAPQTGHPQDQNAQWLLLMSLAVLGSLVLASGVLLRRRAAH